MNMLFQWLIRNVAIVAIIMSLISLILSIVGLVHSSTSTQEKWYKLKKLWSVRHSVFHVTTLFCLTIYILLNWEKCISMQFFSQFDGNNILFLVWIILIFLIIYEVEGKEIKIAKHKKEEVQQSLSDANLKYKLDAMLEQIKSSNPDLDDTHQKEEGEQ